MSVKVRVELRGYRLPALYSAMLRLAPIAGLLTLNRAKIKRASDGGATVIEVSLRGRALDLALRLLPRFGSRVERLLLELFAQKSSVSSRA